MSRQPETTPARFTERPKAIFLAAFVAFFCAIAVFSIATPLMAAPDEPTHVAKAAAVVRGQFIGQLVGGPSSPDGVVHIPAAYANLGVLVSCYTFNANIPASCAPPYKPSGTIVRTTLYNARYQPLYYAIVGLPSLVTDSEIGIYLMRLVSAALSALFLALALMAAVTWGRSRLLLAGVAAAATPSVLFFAGVVNPNGLEISVAVCLWTSLSILLVERLAHPPPGLVALAAVSAGIECLIRSLSPFWVVLTALFVLAAGDWGALRGALRRRAIWLGTAFVVVCGVLASLWILGEGALNVEAPTAPIPRSVTESHLLLIALERTPTYFAEMISRFGWLVAPSPTLTYIVWTAILGCVVFLGLSSASLRRAVVLVALVVAVVVLPVFISTGQAYRIGIPWQGRDILPLAVGVPILASVLAGDSPVFVWFDGFTRRLVNIVVVSAALATAVALYGDLRRNAVGDNGPAFGFFGARWQPPAGIAGILVLGLLAFALLAAVFILAAAGSPTAAPSVGVPVVASVGTVETASADGDDYG